MNDTESSERIMDRRVAGWWPLRMPAIVVFTSVLAAALPGGSGKAFGQEPGAGANQDHVVRVVRAVEQSPRIGAPGKRVTLKASGLPSLTPVQIVIGATRSGFEELAFAQTSIDGDMEATVEVPEWSKRDQPHRFIVFNVYFSSVLAESGIFHVTDADGKVVREGSVGSSGPGCIVLEGDDGEHYRLIGPTDRLRVGDRAVVEGVLRESQEGCGAHLLLNLELESLR